MTKQKIDTMTETSDALGPLKATQHQSEGQNVLSRFRRALSKEIMVGQAHIFVVLGASVILLLSSLWLLSTRVFFPRRLSRKTAVSPARRVFNKRPARLRWSIKSIRFQKQLFRGSSRSSYSTVAVLWYRIHVPIALASQFYASVITVISGHFFSRSRILCL